MLAKIEQRFGETLPAVEFCSLRAVRSRDEILSVRQGVDEPMRRGDDCGGMVTVHDAGGLGYAATSDLTESGIRRAMQAATKIARASAGRSVLDTRNLEMPAPVGEYVGPEDIPWESQTTEEKYAYLRKAANKLNIDDRIVDWEASVWRTELESLYLTSHGGRAYQRLRLLAPSLSATANRGSETHTRTLGSLRGQCKQGGLEVFHACEFKYAGVCIAEEALLLLDAEDCPTGRMPVLLASDQMMLQIHESIGHPLEIDRILGDERNYAGTSFVTPEMFGTYRYGSELLNVTFDPTNPKQFATYRWDDDGAEARKEFIIRDGILQRGLGGTVSQLRSGLPGVANARACHWNRPPIDRMANLNVEPGDSTLAEMIGQVDFGVFMRTNRSWSIDDSRNKFQFGCEYAELIENGKLTRPVKNPNYRGISATFWRNLRAVGKKETVGVFGTPYCGKGEPNQVIRVGHASPACLFDDVDVFGGA
jgi:predicted Zn-dependent protease